MTPLVGCQIWVAIVRVPRSAGGVGDADGRAEDSAFRHPAQVTDDVEGRGQWEVLARGADEDAHLARLDDSVVVPPGEGRTVHVHLERDLLRLVRVEPDLRDRSIVRIITPESLMGFGFNDAALPNGGLEFLGEFAPALVGSIAKPVKDGTVAALVVEGHTDKTGSDEINLRLSQERATNVSLSILDTLRDHPELRGIFVQVQSTAGRGRAEPLATADEGVRGDERNRRVVFKVRLHVPEHVTAVAAIASPEPLPR